MKKIIFLFLLTLSAQSYSGPSCLGKVKTVMDWPEKCIDGNLAYLFEMEGTANEVWVCTISDKSASVVLTALAANKDLRTVFANQEETCGELATNYLKPLYLYVQQ